jgi:hypothetical protein
VAAHGCRSAAQENRTRVLAEQGLLLVAEVVAEFLVAVGPQEPAQHAVVPAADVLVKEFAVDLLAALVALQPAPE